MLSCRMCAPTNPRHSAAHRRTRVRHRPHDGNLRAQVVLDVAGGHRSRYRNHQRFLTDMRPDLLEHLDRKSTRLNSSHVEISYAVFCLKKKKKTNYFSSKSINKNKK